MKKIILTTICTIACTISAYSQNLQLHYDFRRNCATSTIEMFRPDRGGSTFFFVDIDYSPKVSGAYFEIARELCFWQESKADWLSVHVEYNGGLDTQTGSYDNAWLGGLTYSGHSKDYSKTWSLSALYKAIPGCKTASGRNSVHNFQVTGVWEITFAKNWCTFSGFIDFWKEERPWQGTSYILMSEPQFWINLNAIKNWEKVRLSIGTEVELSCNFVDKGFAAMPTVAAKWTF